MRGVGASYSMRVMFTATEQGERSIQMPFKRQQQQKQGKQVLFSS